MRRATAAMLRLVDGGMARIGGARSAREFGHYGVSTLRRDHVEVGDDEVVLSFPGKSEVEHEIVVDDPLLAELSGGTLTCTDFRTWGGTAVALEARATGASEVEAVDAAAAGRRTA